VWGPDPQRAAAFARANARPGLQVAAAASPAEAVRNADLICAVSAASEPIIEATWLKPGVHINLVGAHTAVTREADADTLAKAQVYTEINEFARVESGNLLLAVASGHMSLDDVCGEIGELLLGRISGRASPTSRTVYLSLGNTAQDLAAAAYVVDHADGVP
jgi:ornithine cyclodeaminase